MSDSSFTSLTAALLVAQMPKQFAPIIAANVPDDAASSVLLMRDEQCVSAWDREAASQSEGALALSLFSPRNERVPIIIKSVTDPRLTANDRTILAANGWKRMLLLPVAECVGCNTWLLLARRKGRAFSAGDIRKWETVSNLTSLALIRQPHEARAPRGVMLDAILEATNDAILMLDLTGQVTVANLQFEVFFGISRYLLVGHVLDTLIETFQSSAYYSGDLIVLVQRYRDQYSRVEAGEFGLRLPERRTLVWYTTPVFGANGSVSGRLFVFRDATSEREAARIKSDFMSLVSHQLRTPLTAITGFTELILEGATGPIDHAIYEYLTIIRKAALSLTASVNDVIDVTHLEAQRLEMRPCRVDLYQVIPSAVQPLHMQVEQKKQRLDMQMASGLPNAWADPHRLAQVVSNLVENAVQFTPEQGRITVEARYLVSSDPLPERAPPALIRPTLMIAVHDNGMGISEAEQERLFTSFHRTQQTIGKQLSGLGLGLFLVRSLVEMQGGTVWVRSAPEQGTSFYFTVPSA